MQAATIHGTQMRLLGMGRAFQPELMAMMVEVDLLSGLSLRESEMLAPYLKAYEAGSGCTVFREGDPGHYMCWLVSGQVRIYKESGHDGPVDVAASSRMRVVGEMALVDGEPRSASCEAIKTSVLLLLARESFAKLGEERPALALKLMAGIAKLISRRLRMTSGQLVDLLVA